MQELLSQRSIPLPEKIQEVEWSRLGAQKEEVLVRNASNLGRESGCMVNGHFLDGFLNI